MDLYTQTQRTIYETENSLLLRLESARGNQQEFSQIQAQINQNISTIEQNCEQLEISAKKVAPQRRRHEKQKVEQLRFTVSSINTSLRSAERRHENTMEKERGREDLLNRRYTANDNSTNIGIDIGNKEVAHANKLGQAHRDMDAIINQGYQVLENLNHDTVW